MFGNPIIHILLCLGGAYIQVEHTSICVWLKGEAAKTEVGVAEKQEMKSETARMWMCASSKCCKTCALGKVQAADWD